MVVFLMFDGVTKIVKERHVLEAFARLGYPASLAPVIGTILVICVAIHVVPATSILGAILLTGYLGGATEVNVRAGNPLFETLFPIIFGMLVWGGLYLRDPQLRMLIPLQSRKSNLLDLKKRGSVERIRYGKGKEHAKNHSLPMVR
jgi:hypothetical protein